VAIPVRKCDLFLDIQKNSTIKKDKISSKLCGNTLSTKVKLKRHLEKVHKKTRQINCEVCRKILSDKEELKHHIKDVHENFRRVSCKECDQQLTDSQKLQDDNLYINKGLK